MNLALHIWKWKQIYRWNFIKFDMSSACMKLTGHVMLYCNSCINLTNNSFMGSEPPKFRGSPNIFLTKYQLSVFWCLLFAEKINLLLVNQQNFSQLKLVLRSWKKVNKHDGRHFGVLVAIYQKPKDENMRWTGHKSKNVSFL